MNLRLALGRWSLRSDSTTGTVSRRIYWRGRWTPLVRVTQRVGG